jgi:hypothetical protein
MLPQPELPYVVVSSSSRSPHITLPHPLGEASLDMQSSMTDVLALCNYAGTGQLGAFQYQDLVISIIQRLIDYAPLGGVRPSHWLDDLCHLGLLTFMSTILYHTREIKPTCSVLLSRLLWTQLDTFGDQMVDTEANNYSPLNLWLIFIYAISATEYELLCDADSRVAHRIHTVSKELALETWEDAQTHLKVFPWIAALHDSPGKKLWESVVRR